MSPYVQFHEDLRLERLIRCKQYSTNWLANLSALNRLVYSGDSIKTDQRSSFIDVYTIDLIVHLPFQSKGICVGHLSVLKSKKRSKPVLLSS